MQDDLLISLYYFRIFPQKVLYPPQKNLRIRQKVSYLCSEKLSASGDAPRLSEQGLCPCTALREHPQTSSSGVNPLTSTTSGHPQFFGRVCQKSKYYVHVQKPSTSGDFFPRLSELCPWTTLGDFEVPIPRSHSCIKW